MEGLMVEPLPSHEASSRGCWQSLRLQFSSRTAAVAHPEVGFAVCPAISLVVDNDQVQGMSQYRPAPGIPLLPAAMA